MFLFTVVMDPDAVCIGSRKIVATSGMAAVETGTIEPALLLHFLSFTIIRPRGVQGGDHHWPSPGQCWPVPVHIRRWLPSLRVL